MAAVSAIVAVAGLAITAGTMIDQDNKAKKAKKSLDDNRKRLAKIEYSNPYASLQAPDVSSAANEQISRQTAEGVQAAQDLGEAGAAQITGMVQAGRNAALEASQTQAAYNYDRDLKVAQGEAVKQANNIASQKEAIQASIDADEMAMNNAKANVSAGVSDIVTGVGAVAGEIGAATSLESKAQRSNKKMNRDINAGRPVNNQSNIYGFTDEQMAALSVGSIY